MIKKKFPILLCIIIFFALFNFFDARIELKKYPPDFKIAVVQVSSAKLKSFISFYDDNLNQISTMKINLGGLAQCWDWPKNFNGKVYLNVKGTDLWLKSHIAEFDLANGKIKLHDVKQKFNTCSALDEKNIFVANCDGNANIVKYNLSAHKKNKLTIPNMYITHMKIYENVLYAFGNFSCPADKSFLYLIDKNDMRLLKTVDITNCGLAQYDSIKINDELYFSNYTQTDKFGNEIKNNSLGKYNLKTGKLEKINLQHVCPKQLLRLENNLIISHEDWHQNGKYLSIYDTQTGKIKSVELKNAPYQIYLLDDKLYSIDRQKLYKYDLKSFQLEKEVDLQTQQKCGKDFFISAFFTKQPTHYD